MELFCGHRLQICAIVEGNFYFLFIGFEEITFWARIANPRYRYGEIFT